MPCLWNFWPLAEALRPGGTTNDACPCVRSSGSTTAVTTCTSAIPPVRRPGLGAVDDPLVGLLASGPRGCASPPRQDPRRARRAERTPDGGHRACRTSQAGTHSGHLLVGAVGADAGGGQRAADDRQPDAGIAQKKLLHRDGKPRPVSSTAWATRKSTEYRPIWPPPRRPARGTPPSSHSAAAGRTTSAANWCTQSRSSRWSG